MLAYVTSQNVFDHIGPHDVLAFSACSRIGRSQYQILAKEARSFEFCASDVLFTLSVQCFHRFLRGEVAIKGEGEWEGAHVTDLQCKHLYCIVHWLPQ